MCDEEGDVAVDNQSADESLLGALQNLDDLCLLDVSLATCHEREAHAVATERRHRVALGDEDGLVAANGNHRVLAVGLAHEDALLYLSASVELVGRVADAREEVVPRHLLHRVDGEHLLRVCVEFQLSEYLLERQCLVGLRREELLQHLGHLLFVQALAAFLLFSHSMMRFLFGFLCKLTKKFSYCRVSLQLFCICQEKGVPLRRKSNIGGFF